MSAIESPELSHTGSPIVSLDAIGCGDYEPWHPSEAPKPPASKQKRESLILASARLATKDAIGIRTRTSTLTLCIRVPKDTGSQVIVLTSLASQAVAPFAELSIIDLASKKVTLLAKAMGYDTPEAAAANMTYLPFGPADLHAYYPTVSPVGSGGYFWVFFDSIRHYGVFGLQRQLWVAAIEISHDGTYTRDPSHPAFYVSGQSSAPFCGNHFEHRIIAEFLVGQLLPIVRRPSLVPRRDHPPTGITSDPFVSPPTPSAACSIRSRRRRIAPS